LYNCSHQCKWNKIRACTAGLNFEKQ
jgi:hypothetical protein